MSFYKVLYKDKDGKLHSAITTNLSIEYGKTTKAPEGTPLFVFGSLRAAQVFASNKNGLVIFHVSVVNPKLYEHHIINPSYLNGTNKETVRSFWDHLNLHSFINPSWRGWQLRYAPFQTYLCDEVTLLEEV